jgi:hypothetical protein
MQSWFYKSQLVCAHPASMCHMVCQGSTYEEQELVAEF